MPGAWDARDEKELQEKLAELKALTAKRSATDRRAKDARLRGEGPSRYAPPVDPNSIVKPLGAKPRTALCRECNEKPAARGEHFCSRACEKAWIMREFPEDAKRGIAMDRARMRRALDAAYRIGELGSLERLIADPRTPDRIREDAERRLAALVKSGKQVRAADGELRVGDKVKMRGSVYTIVDIDEDGKLSLEGAQGRKRGVSQRSVEPHRPLPKIFAKDRRAADRQVRDGVGLTFTSLDAWKRQAAAMGFVVRRGVHPSGDPTDYYTAKTRDGNWRGEFDVAKKSGALVEGRTTDRSRMRRALDAALDMAAKDVAALRVGQYVSSREWAKGAAGKVIDVSEARAKIEVHEPWPGSITEYTWRTESWPKADWGALSSSSTTTTEKIDAEAAARRAAKKRVLDTAAAETAKAHCRYCGMPVTPGKTCGRTQCIERAKREAAKNRVLDMAAKDEKPGALAAEEAENNFWGTLRSKQDIHGRVAQGDYDLLKTLADKYYALYLNLDSAQRRDRRLSSPGALRKALWQLTVRKR